MGRGLRPGMGVKTSFAYVDAGGRCYTGPAGFWAFRTRLRELAVTYGYENRLKEPGNTVGWRKRFVFLYRQAQGWFNRDTIGAVYRIKGNNNASNPTFRPYVTAAGMYVKPQAPKPLLLEGRNA